MDFVYEPEARFFHKVDISSKLLKAILFSCENSAG